MSGFPYSRRRFPITAMLLLVLLSAGIPLLADSFHPKPPPDKFQPTLDQALQPYTPSGQYQGTLKAVTSQTVEFVLRGWIKRFHELQPGVTITFVPSGGEPAAAALAGDKADFAIITREISPDGMQKFVREHSYSPLAVPICGGSYRSKSYSDVMDLIVNADNPLDKITYAQLDAMYSADRKRGQPIAISTWGQLGLTGEWANKPIHAWTIQPYDGFEEFIRETVLDGGEFRTALNRDDDGTRPLSDDVAADKYAISIDSLAWVKPGTKRLAIAVNSDGPYYRDTPEDVFSWKYPLNRKIYMYINREPGTAVPPILKEFLRFILSKDGQQIVVDDQVYIPLNRPMVEKSQAMIQ